MTQHNVIVCLMGTSVEGVICIGRASQPNFHYGAEGVGRDVRQLRLQAAGCTETNAEAPLWSFLHVCVARDLSRQSRDSKIKLRRQI